jgi:murein DD-endopeptidase / murein LD-carboxypeptidase
MRKVVLVLSLAWIAFVTVGCKTTTAVKRYKSAPMTQTEIALIEADTATSASVNYNETSPEFRKYNENIRRVNAPYDVVTRLNKEIDKYIGTRYKYGGLKDKGLDCSGFVFRVYMGALNLELPHSSSMQARLGAAVGKSELQFGDLVFFNIRGRGISHVGIYVGEGNFAHASTRLGVVVSSLQEKYYKERYVSARRIL